MKERSITVRLDRKRSAYDVTIGSEQLDRIGTWACRCLSSSSQKILIVSNRKVSGLYGSQVGTSLDRAGFDVSNHLIGDGERFKNMRTLEQLLHVLGERRFARTDAILALGGGVVGDLAGFAASIHLRGIPLLQIPTTLLSMIDSSVGGKTGVNGPFGKNTVGTFYQPKGVCIDVDVLATLAQRELTAGFCEAIKQGAISGPSLLNQTAGLLERYPIEKFRRHMKDERFRASLTDLISRQVRFKAGIVQNDETESVENTSPRSRKILNFGHTLAHALEKVTNYRQLKHGEAVGYGVMFAAALSKSLELLSQDEVDLLNDVVHRAGPLPPLGNIDPLELIKAIAYDKKRVGKSLHWILLRDIGKPVIVPGTDIPLPAIKSTLRSVINN